MLHSTQYTRVIRHFRGKFGFPTTTPMALDRCWFACWMRSCEKPGRRGNRTHRIGLWLGFPWVPWRSRVERKDHRLNRSRADGRHREKASGFPGGLKPGLGPFGTCPEGHDVGHVFLRRVARAHPRGRARVSTHRARRRRPRNNLPRQPSVGHNMLGSSRRSDRCHSRRSLQSGSARSAALHKRSSR